MSHQPSLKHISPKDTPKHLHIPPTDSYRPISPCSVSSSRNGKKTPSKMIRSGAETPSSFTNVYLKNLSQIVLKTNSTNPEPSDTTSRTNDNPLFRPLVKQYSLDHQKMLRAVKAEPKKNSNSFSPKKHLSNEKKSSPVHEQSTFSTIAAQRISEGQFFKSANTDLINRETSTKSPQKRLAINRSQRASHGHELHHIMQTSSPAEKFNRKDHLHHDQKEESSYVSIRKMRQEYYDSPRSVRTQGGYHFSKRTSTDFTISVHQSELSSRHLPTENSSQFDEKAYLIIPSSPLTVRESTESEVATETLHTDVSLIDVISNPQHKSSPTNQGITEGFSSFHKNRPDYNHKIFSPSIRKSKIEIIKQHLDEPKTVDVILIDGKWRSINDVQEISSLQQSLAESVSRNNTDQNMTQKRKPIKSRSTHQLDLLHVVGDKHSEQQVKSEVIDDAPKKVNSFKKQKSHDNLVKRPHRIDDLFTHHKRSEATTPKIDDLFTHHKRNEAKTTQIHVSPPQNEEETTLVSGYIEIQEGVVSEEKPKKASKAIKETESRAATHHYHNQIESIPKIQELPQKEEESATLISNNPFVQEETEKPQWAELNREAEFSETVHQSELISVVTHCSSPQKEGNDRVLPIHHEQGFEEENAEENITPEEKTENYFEHEVRIDKTELVQEVQAEVQGSEIQIQKELSTQQQNQEYSSHEEQRVEKAHQNILHADLTVHHIKCPVEDVICEVEEEQEAGNEEEEIIDRKAKEEKIAQEEDKGELGVKIEEESYRPEAFEKESLQQPVLNSSTLKAAQEEEEPETFNQKTLCEAEEKQETASTVKISQQEEEESIAPIQDEAKTEEQGYPPVASEREVLQKPILNSSTLETAEEEGEPETFNQKTLCEAEEKQETASTVKISQQEGKESIASTKDEAKTEEQSYSLAVSEKESLQQPILNSSTLKTAEEKKEDEEKPSHDGIQTESSNQKTPCEVEESQEMAPTIIISQQEEEGSSAPIKDEAKTEEHGCPPVASEREVLQQPILNSSTLETVEEKKEEEKPETSNQNTLCEAEEKQETASTVKISQQEEEGSSAPIKDEAKTEEQGCPPVASEREVLQQPILNSSTLETVEEKKEEEKPETSNQNTLCEVKEKQEVAPIVKIAQEKVVLAVQNKDETQTEEQRSIAIPVKESSHQLNMRSSTVESTPKLLHTEERKEEEKLSNDGSQTDKKVENAHDLSSPSSFLESEDRSHDWNHLIGDTLKIKRFGEHHHGSQNGLDDHEHEQDMTTIFEENIAKFETLKKLNNQDGAVQLLKDVSDDLERYIQEKAKPQEEAAAKVLKIHVYNRLGVEYYEKGQYEEVLQQCKKTLEIDHSNIQALFKLYQTNSKLGKKEQASAVIKRVRKIMQNPFLYQYNQQFILDKFTMPTQTNSQSNQSLQDMNDSRLSFF